MLIARQQGLSLIELMVGLLLGTIAVAGVLRVYSSTTQSSASALELGNLNQDLRTMIALMVRDIRRAGYVTSSSVTNEAAFLTLLRHNPFTTVRVDNDGSCITYAYNKNMLNPDRVESSEQFGFKLANDTTFSPAKPVLRMRRSGTDAACSNGVWESVTARDVKVTQLQFTVQENQLNISQTLNNPTAPVQTSCQVGDQCLLLRSVTIRLTAALVDEPCVTQTLSETVRIRNPAYCYVVKVNPVGCL